MRKRLLIVGVALLLLSGALGLVLAGIRLAWEEVPSPPDPAAAGVPAHDRLLHKVRT